MGVLITTHLHADLDCLGAMVGALKLYPEARVLFPGSQEPAVRELLESGLVKLPEIRVRELDPEGVDLVVLVDAQDLGRLGPVSEKLEGRKDLHIVAYDHHRDAVPGEGIELHLRPVGATCTLMTSLLQEKRLTIEPNEATALAAGIYEDTGSLLFPETTPEDLTAVSYLLGCGADLRRVSDLLQRPLSPEQAALYHELVQNARTHRLRGEEVVLSEARPGHSVPDAALVVHQFVESSRMGHFLALIAMEGRILLVARSRIAGLDMAAVARDLGGGGHRAAASASLRGLTLPEARDRVLEAVGRHLQPPLRARDVMTRPVVLLPAEVPVRGAVEAMNRKRVNALPVTEKGRIVGAVTRQAADVALAHGLGEAGVLTLAEGPVAFVDGEADLDEVERRLLGGPVRFVLVGEGPESRPEGIITRMVLFRHRYRQRTRASAVPAPLAGAATEDVTATLRRRLPENALAWLDRAGRQAGDMRIRAYLVGGVVRDLLLGSPVEDLDLVIEGDAATFARGLAGPGDRLRVHPAFGTAMIRTSDGLRIDLAAARTEYYPEPGALPRVAEGDLRQDLFRRDFTVNALAIALHPDGQGLLVDYFDGRKDLRRGALRVLHGLSFVEDPTRAYRAVRFALRLSFSLGRETESLLKAAVRQGVFAGLKGSRLYRELRPILEGPRPARALEILDGYGLLQAAHPALVRTRRSAERASRLEEVLAWYRLLYRSERPRTAVTFLMALTERRSPDTRRALAGRFALPRREAELLESFDLPLRTLITRLGRRDRPPRPSTVFFACRGEPLELLLYAMAKTGRETARRSIALYLRSLAETRLEIRGRDLMARGVEAGPALGRVMRRTLAARLDGKIRGREEELAFALEAAGREARS
jgi:tRNA nucleotidyltransferase (CCA-adding enzyme)